MQENAACPRAVIIGGAPIGKYDVIREYLRPDDCFIFCDSGLSHLEALGVQPDLIIGDFDSHEDPHLPVETITLPREKDDTDTVFAVKEALKRGFDVFLLIGALGARMDHSLANLSILLMLDTAGKRGMIVDDYSELEIVSPRSGTARISDQYPYFSLVNISGEAAGITIRHAKYLLENGEISCDYQYGVSNEPLPGETAEVEVKKGRLLLIRDRR